MSDVSHAQEVDFWSETIKSFQPLGLTYPEITVKRLQKPPFRFIFDIVSAINARYAAYLHVLPAALTDSANVDSKEKKIEYLRILIDYVGRLLNRTISVNPKKIVTGSEPEKTNIFLQCLAKACGLAQEDRAQTKAKEVCAHSEGKNNAGPSTGKEVAKTFLGDSFSCSLQEAALQGHELLPRRRKNSLTERQRQESCTQVLANSKAFSLKLSALSINLKPNEPQDIKEVGKAIVRMWREQQNPNMELTSSPLAQDALEIAIRRQIERLKQIQELIKENDVILDSLETFLA
ncbi:unnamed protein product [Phytomonas sp. Hart1]|nr:unnamed protein product [Phytomonas sp. Hart1]|eukprot:CCW70631.1 unnamed protein product [Phytomonas sp. isolate Hart1]